MTAQDLIPLFVALTVFLAWLVVGHYYFQSPRHVLVGHQVTVYGLLGLIAAVWTLAWVWHTLELPNPNIYTVALDVTALIVCGGLLTWAMGKQDQGTEIRRLRAENARLLRQQDSEEVRKPIHD